jgi:chloramphenicol-sensitive protein RarD
MVLKNYIGLIAAVWAYTIWGVLPLYWKLLEKVPAYEIMAHRMSWSLVLTLGLVMVMGRGPAVKKAMGEKSNLLVYTLAASLLSVNWFLYIWAVNAGYIIEASLGYFINPLINVFFGMVFFDEKMRPVQWLALLLAALGVLYLTLYYGRFPWIALALGISFAIYGLIHKKNSMAALDGLCLETAMLFIPATAFLLFLEITGKGAFGSGDISMTLLLAGTGLITTAPLLLFGFAAKKIALSTLGLLQYIAPTTNLLIGLFIYHEDFPVARMIGFMLIWLALALYMMENIVRRYRQQRVVLGEC